MRARIAGCLLAWLQVMMGRRSGLCPCLRFNVYLPRGSLRRDRQPASEFGLVVTAAGALSGDKLGRSCHSSNQYIRDTYSRQGPERLFSSIVTRTLQIEDLN